MKRICLVACAGKKLGFEARASEIYISDLFTKSKHFAELYCDEWYILSAKHHLLKPSDAVSPYDLTLNTLNRGKLDDWAAKVISQLRQFTSRGDHVTILAGERYRENVVGWLEAHGCFVSVPLKGLGIGRQLQLLGRACENKLRLKELDRFYSLLADVSKMPNQFVPLKELRVPSNMSHGVYFFFEKGQQRRFGDSLSLRIVRIGTHAVSQDSKATLWNRLRTHKGVEGGGGSHRSSIFRLHVGNAILNKEGISHETWGIGGNASASVKEAESELEIKVSEYIGNLRVAYIPIMDPASKDSDRSYIERNSIALLTYGGALDVPSGAWLGGFSSREQILQSGLWNVNYIGERYDARFLNVLEKIVRNYLSASPVSCSLAPHGWRLRTDSEEQLF